MATKSTSAKKVPAAKQGAAASKLARKSPTKKSVAAGTARPAAVKSASRATAKAPAVKGAPKNPPVIVTQPKAAVVASAPTPAPVEKMVAVADKGKQKKSKMVRDSFTMPELEYQALGDVKKACLKAGLAVKKSELLRVGVAIIKDMDIERLRIALATLAPLKAGRPKVAK